MSLTLLEVWQSSWVWIFEVLIAKGQAKINEIPTVQKDKLKWTDAMIELIVKLFNLSMS